MHITDHSIIILSKNIKRRKISQKENYGIELDYR